MAFASIRTCLPAAAQLALSPAVAGGQPPPAACGPGPAAAVTVSGLRAPTGFLTVYLWSDDPGAFLEHGGALQRIELPAASGPVRLCLPAPRPGRYAVSVRHDVDGDRRRYDLNDGAGFSRNPPLSLTRTRPALGAVLLTIGTGATPVEIAMNYRFGLSVHPVRARPGGR